MIINFTFTTTKQTDLEEHTSFVWYQDVRTNSTFSTPKQSAPQKYRVWRHHNELNLKHNKTNWFTKPISILPKEIIESCLHTNPNWKKKRYQGNMVTSLLAHQN